MNAEILLQHFDRIGEAPDVIPRLRRFILDLAVRGKLVEQNPEDEPAGELLKRIRAEKMRLVREGKIKKDQPAAPIRANEFPFDLPKQWAWVRLGSTIHLVSGQHLQPGEYSDEEQAGIPYITGPSDFRENGLLITRYALIQKAVAYKGQLLLTVKGSGVGKATICDLPKVVISRQLMAITAIDWSSQFLRIITHSLSEALRLRARSLIPGIAREDVEEFVFAIPPLAEQHRIVAKVDELMALCDQLEAARNEREARRGRLVAASLQRIGTATADEAKDAARFHLDHLPRFTTRPEHIKQLRQTILDLAVRGRLVPQDPSDEPAGELLEQIQDEKKALVKAGTLKKDKDIWDGLPEIPPYLLPEKWVWVRLQDLFEISRGGSPRPAGDPLYFGGHIPWITVREITKDSGKILVTTDDGLTELGSTKSRFINPDDLLLTNSGATLGVPKISQIRGCINDGVAVLRQFHSVNLNDFAYLYLQSQIAAFRQINQGMGQPNLNTPIIAGWFFPLPPLAEQHRIVAKVDELMNLCGQLEAQLAATEADSRRLLEAVLRDALAPAKANAAAA